MQESVNRLGALADEFRELEARLADPDTTSDLDLLRTVSRRYRELEPIVAAQQALGARQGDLAVARELLEHATEDERAHLEDEVDEALGEIERLEGELRELLLPPRPARRTGGDHGDPRRRRWRGSQPLRPRPLRHVSRLCRQPRLEGRDAVARHERTGWCQPGHVRRPRRGRVAAAQVRGRPTPGAAVPVTESQGRVHTSSATVAVLPRPTRST